MSQSIVQFAIVVADYDEAIDFYVSKLGFQLLEDTFIKEQNKRWVVVSPARSTGAAVLLAKASKPEQADVIGKQAGGRVFVFLSTDDCHRDYKKYQARGVVFTQEPIKHGYGTVAVFEDLYGNRWDLIEYSVEDTCGSRPTE